MTIQVALLAFLLLDEPLTAGQWGLIGAVAAATATVQITGKTPTSK